MKNRESKVRLLDPKNVLKRGYSITFKDSKPIKSIDGINENDIIKTVLYDGDITSFVKDKQKENEQKSD
jgi:exodeoxyribonuclease VII large subunit